MLPGKARFWDLATPLLGQAGVTRFDDDGPAGLTMEGRLRRFVRSFAISQPPAANKAKRRPLNRWLV